MSDLSITSEKRRAMEREYTALHEGLSPRQWLKEKWVDPGLITPFGYATAIQYEKAVPGEDPDYMHPWAEQAQPSIGVDSQGHLQFATGKYEVSHRGIEDRVLPGQKPSRSLRQPYVQNERWIRHAPSHLTTLGKLRWVRYNPVGQDGPAKTLRFHGHNAPDVARDQSGNLHVLGGRYSIKAETGVLQMAHRRHHRRHARYNPSSIVRRGSRESAAMHAGKSVLTGAAVAAVAVATITGLDYALSKWTTGSPTAKLLTKTGAGIAALAGGSFLPQSLAPVTLGVGGGALIDAGLDAYNQYLAPQIARMLAPSQPAANPPANPGAGVSLPAGAPSRFAAYNQQSCAVPGMRR